MIKYLKAHNKAIYIVLAGILTFCLAASYIPALSFLSSWVSPPAALFLGLAFALICGEAYPAFNSRFSKYLLQYSVVGLGFGMNLQESLASGKEGMMFTVVCSSAARC